MKSARIRSFSGPYFPAFGLNRRDNSVKLDTVYLLSVFLSVGTTIATFALSGKVDKVILLFMAIDKGFERTSVANLTNLIDSLSVPAASSEFKEFNTFSTSSEITKILREKSLSDQDFDPTSDLILMILGWFL